MLTWCGARNGARTRYGRMTQRYARQVAPGARVAQVHVRRFAACATSRPRLLGLKALSAGGARADRGAGCRAAVTTQLLCVRCRCALSNNIEPTHRMHSSHTWTCATRDAPPARSAPRPGVRVDLSLVLSSTSLDDSRALRRPARHAFTGARALVHGMLGVKRGDMAPLASDSSAQMFFLFCVTWRSGRIFGSWPVQNELCQCVPGN